MATRSAKLKLLLPALGEFNNAWHTPLNDNFNTIDAAISDLQDEVQNARFTQPTLKEFLQESHNTDGSLKAIPEIDHARVSEVFGFPAGYENGVLDADEESFILRRALKARDFALFHARRGKGSLENGIAYRDALAGNMVVSGLSDATGASTWAGFTSTKAIIDGSSTPIEFLIDGHLCSLRTLEEIDLSSELASGTFYAYAEYQEDGVVIASNSAANAGVDGNDVPRLFQDPTKDFVDLGVQPGDILRILPDSGVFAEGDYIIDEVAPDSDVTQLTIIGRFISDSPTPSLAGGYEIRDPLRPTLGYASDKSVTAGRIYFADVKYNGSVVTEVNPLPIKNKFVGDWRSIDVSSTPDFEEIWNHDLGTDELDITIQASIANDGSEPVEELSLADLRSTLGVDTTIGTLASSIDQSALDVDAAVGTLVTQPASTDSHSHNVTGAPDVTLTGLITSSLSGAPDSSLTGSLEVANAVKMKASKNKIWIKNPVSGVFYRDYSGNIRTSGFIRVIVTKKG